MKWAGHVERLGEVGGACGYIGRSGRGMWRDWMKWAGHVERLDEVGGSCREIG